MRSSKNILHAGQQHHYKRRKSCIIQGWVRSGWVRQRQGGLTPWGAGQHITVLHLNKQATVVLLSRYYFTREKNYFVSRCFCMKGVKIPNCLRPLKSFKAKMGFEKKMLRAQCFLQLYSSLIFGLVSNNTCKKALKIINVFFLSYTNCLFEMLENPKKGRRKKQFSYIF